MSSDGYIIRFNSDSKFNEPLVADFSPGNLKWLKGSYTGGELQEQHALFAAMLREWDVLAKDVSTMQNAVATLEYKAMPYCRDGEEPTPEAQAVADLVNDALWRRCEAAPGTWRQNFQDLLGSIYHGILRGVQVHEIVWRHDAEMWYPVGYLPVLPQYFAWSNKVGEPDRLLLFREGNYRAGEGEEFPQDRFIVSLNKRGPDHPMFNAVFNALVVHFAAARWGLAWLREYAQVYGKPFRMWNVDSDEDKRKLEAELARKPVLNDVVAVGEKDRVQMVAAPASGATMPQKVLYDIAERGCHKLILGQTLTSDTGEHGGSLAQAKVHAGVQQDEVLANGNFVCDILNAQLVPAIVRMNYGSSEVPMPEVRCSVPNCAKNEAQMEYYIKMTKELGLPVKAADLYEKFGIVPPEDDDSVVVGGSVREDGGKDAPAPEAGKTVPEAGRDAKEDQDKPAEAGTQDDEREDPTEGERLTASKAADWRDMEAEDILNSVYGKWTGPMLKRLREMVDKGATPAQIRKEIKEGRLRPDTREFARLVAAAMMEPAEGESTDKGKEA